MTADPGVAVEPSGSRPGEGRRTVAIVADDLIWSTRLSGLVEGAGVAAHVVRSVDALEAAVRGGTRRVVVDLTARSYDPLAAISTAAAGGASVLAVGPHDDHAARKEALAAGAVRVLAYRKLADDGPAAIGRWLGEADAATDAATGTAR